MPVDAVKLVPVPVQVEVVVPLAFNMLEPPFKVPAVRATLPVNVCVKLTPRLSVPPVPLMVNPAPFTLPVVDPEAVNVAVPAVLVIDTVPVVVKPPMVFVTNVPEIVTPPDPEYVPELVKLVLANVNKKVLIANVPPLLIVSVEAVVPAAPTVHVAVAVIVAQLSIVKVSPAVIKLEGCDPAPVHTPAVVPQLVVAVGETPFLPK